MDKKISEYLSYLIGDIEKNEKVEEQSEKVEKNGSESSVNNKKSDNVSSGENSNNQESSKNNDNENNSKVVSMSMQYKEINESDNEDWNKIKKGIEDMYVSWAIIESDLKIKSEISQEDLDKVNRKYR